jgi:hypothetical protein
MSVGFPVPSPNSPSAVPGEDTSPDRAIGNGQVALFAKSGLALASNILNIGSATGLELQSYTESLGASDIAPATFDDFDWLDATDGNGFCKPVNGLYLARLYVYDPPSTAVYMESWFSGQGAYAHNIPPVVKPLSSATTISTSVFVPVYGYETGGTLRLQCRFYTSARALITSGTGIGIDLHLSQIAAY